MQRFWWHSQKSESRSQVSVKRERAEERAEDQTGVHMTAAVDVNRGKRQYHQRGQQRAWNIQEDPNHGRSLPGRKVSSFKCHGQKKRMRQGQRLGTCLSGVAAHPCKSHFINELGPKSHGKGFRRGQGRMAVWGVGWGRAVSGCKQGKNDSFPEGQSLDPASRRSLHEWLQ